ncbi:MAG: 50S ribosomal protein L32 [Armatimonadetes bacterium]|nr:50S ribosomal protein L32 [Armatimonadota bacterium]
MALQKRRRSKARTGHRRSRWRMRAAGMVSCPQCHALMIPHRVCEACGYYGGRQVIVKETEEKS